MQKVTIAAPVAFSSFRGNPLQSVLHPSRRMQRGTGDCSQDWWVTGHLQNFGQRNAPISGRIHKKKSEITQVTLLSENFISKLEDKMKEEALLLTSQERNVYDVTAFVKKQNDEFLLDNLNIVDERNLLMMEPLTNYCFSTLERTKIVLFFSKVDYNIESWYSQQRTTCQVEIRVHKRLFVATRQKWDLLDKLPQKTCVIKSKYQSKKDGKQRWSGDQQKSQESKRNRVLGTGTASS